LQLPIVSHGSTQRQRLALALIFITPRLLDRQLPRSAQGVIEPHLLASLGWLMVRFPFCIEPLKAFAKSGRRATQTAIT
jgi:hypothetical protein